MFFVFTCLFFALAYALKGGSGRVIFPWWQRLREKNEIVMFLLNGKIISSFAVFIFFLVFMAELDALKGAHGVAEYGVNFFPAVLMVCGWLLSVSPSVGEEHGAIGRIGHVWGDYIYKGFGRSYGVKKAVQRGVWIGAIMALVSGYMPYICFSFLYVPCVFVGQEVYHRLAKMDSWIWSEALVGFVVYGIPTALLLS